MPTTLGALYQDLYRQLSDGKIEFADLETRMILAHAAGIDQTRILGYPEDIINDGIANQAQAYVERRKVGEPMAHIVGSREFWSLDFIVSPDTLIPRPDSETLIEAVLNATPNKQADLKILDLGTGSGCLLLSLLSDLPNAQGIGVDINEKAIKIARANAENLSLAARSSFQTGDWFAKLNGKYDIIISNPPYIPKSDIADLDPGVKDFEPILALSGGADGLNAYRIIAQQSQDFLVDGGLLCAEFGIGQTRDIKDIFIKNGFDIIEICQDYGKIDRCILATVVK